MCGLLIVILYYLRKQKVTAKMNPQMTLANSNSIGAVAMTDIPSNFSLDGDPLSSPMSAFSPTPQSPPPMEEDSRYSIIIHLLKKCDPDDWYSYFTKFLAEKLTDQTLRHLPCDPNNDAEPIWRDLIPPMGVRVAFKRNWSRQLEMETKHETKGQTQNTFESDEAELANTMTRRLPSVPDLPKSPATPLDTAELDVDVEGNETRLDDEEPVVPVTLDAFPAIYPMQDIEPMENVNAESDIIGMNEMGNIHPTNGMDGRNHMNQRKQIELEMEHKADALALPEEPQQEHSYDISRGPDAEPMFATSGMSGYGDDNENNEDYEDHHDDMMLHQQSSGFTQNGFQNTGTNQGPMEVKPAFSHFEAQPMYHDGAELQHGDDTFGDPNAGGMTPDGQNTGHYDGTEIKYRDEVNSDHSDEDHQMYGAGKGRSTLGGPGRQSFKE